MSYKEAREDFIYEYRKEVMGTEILDGITFEIQCELDIYGLELIFKDKGEVV